MTGLWLLSRCVPLFLLLSLSSARLLGQDKQESAQKDRTESKRVRNIAVKAGDTVELRCPLSSASDSFTLVVEFKGEDSIASIVQAFSKDDVSLEVKQNRLFVKLLARVKGHIDIVGARHSLYRLFLRPAERPEEADEFVSISFKEAKSDAPQETDEASDLPKPIRLVRAMALLRVPKDGRVAKPGGKESPIVHEVDQIRYRLFCVYELDELVGWVLRLENLSQDKSFDIDLSRFSEDSLVLLGTKDLALAPQSSTFVYLIFNSEEK